VPKDTGVTIRSRPVKLSVWSDTDSVASVIAWTSGTTRSYNERASSVGLTLPVDRRNSSTCNAASRSLTRLLITDFETFRRFAADVTLPASITLMNVRMSSKRHFMVFSQYSAATGASVSWRESQCCICKFISSGGIVMLSFRSVMIQSEPATTRITIRMPNPSASTLFVSSGPVVMCKKNTR
jgi:hypothetical protein